MKKEHLEIVDIEHRHKIEEKDAEKHKQWVAYVETHKALSLGDAPDETQLAIENQKREEEEQDEPPKKKTMEKFYLEKLEERIKATRSLMALAQDTVTPSGGETEMENSRAQEFSTDSIIIININNKYSFFFFFFSFFSFLH